MFRGAPVLSNLMILTGIRPSITQLQFVRGGVLSKNTSRATSTWFQRAPASPTSTFRYCHSGACSEPRHILIFFYVASRVLSFTRRWMSRLDRTALRAARLALKQEIRALLPKTLVVSRDPLPPSPIPNTPVSSNSFHPCRMRTCKPVSSVRNS